ncbi:hypothetical protein HM1_0415 [Heliomicrobium modesticaldum Ice1]|uniref:Uncharacterized protein n=1 Tax=Heliobacterium modesticaldum (strain ATCC 51547 / Ice1) TaxID=498761 RepID=B0TF49_HELMI|nr:hypothetical protein HM1_0415 [Heliomicrobium modesticaldum Ice1]
MADVIYYFANSFPYPSNQFTGQTNAQSVNVNEESRAIAQAIFSKSSPFG